MAVGIPSWVVLLAVFNENLTGIPWVAGLAMATVLATVITVAADRRAFGGARAGARLGHLGRGVLIWVAVFLVLALIVSADDRSGAAVIAIPFVGASIVAAGVELARRALGRR